MDLPVQEAGAETPLQLSVIISTYNRRETLLSKCLPSIFDQDLASDQYEVIIIVDGSTDATGAALRELRPACTLRVVEQPNCGLSKSRNTGIAMARGQLVMFVDDDFICHRDVFRLHMEAHTDSEAVVVHGAVYLAKGSPASILSNANESWYERYNSLLSTHGGAIWPDGVFLISNSSMPRSVLLSCGGFDEDLPAMDDFELGLRMWKAGVKFKYLPSAVCYELSVKSWRSFLFNDGDAFGRTAVMLSRKHPDYRVRSPLLSGMGSTVWWRRLLRQIAIQSPITPAYLLTLPIWACERLCRFAEVQKGGLHLLEIGRRLTEFRAAKKECGTWREFDREFCMRLPVLLYHHVGPEDPRTNRSLTVSPTRFERQIRWLARRGFHGICPADWLRWRSQGKALPDKPVLITFDDGYADLAEHALPVLRRYGFGAAVFVVSGQLGGTNAWDEARGSGTHRLLSEEQICHWARNGIEFGSHSRTHSDLTTLSPEELQVEVLGGKSDLECIVQSRIISFAYPYGHHSENVDEAVQEAFDLAFGIDPHERGMNHLLSDPHRMRRTMVQPDDLVMDVACRAIMGYSPLEGLRARLRLRTRLKHAARRVFGESLDS